MVMMVILFLSSVSFQNGVGWKRMRNERERESDSILCFFQDLSFFVGGKQSGVKGLFLSAMPTMTAH
jgi:hypothetical protein